MNALIITIHDERQLNLDLTTNNVPSAYYFDFSRAPSFYRQFGSGN